jgi:hypothetical protein
MQIRNFVAIALAVFAVLYALAYLHGCAALTPADKAAIAADGVHIAVCQDHGRECKRLDGGDCWSVYDTCMKDGGLR